MRETSPSPSEMHPEVPKFVAFRYKPGKLNRVKKVLEFMLHEEEKMFESVAKEFVDQTDEP